MLKSRQQYLMTWVTFGLLLSSGVGLLVLSWNAKVSGSPSPIVIVVLWLLMSASGIYLFLLAVKKAHRIWIDDERRKKEEEEAEKKASVGTSSALREDKKLDVASTARKLVRRIPEEETLKDSGQEILNNLAHELEIMSGVIYIREKKVFRSVATYALASNTEPYSFEEGEGLTGQAAANQQILVLTNLPEGHREVYSGLGKSEPAYLAIVPLLHKNRTIAVLECSGYKYEPQDIEAMFRIFARDLMAKLSAHLK